MKVSDLDLEENIELNEKDALIVVDLQYDFLPGGSLAVDNGDEIIDGVNIVAKIFKENGNRVVFTQDWHPPNHKSFASAHHGKNPGDEYTEMKAIGPVLWPDHCVQGTKGAQLHDSLDNTIGDAIIRKGTDPKVDSYSTFFDNNKIVETGLSGYLKCLGIKRIFLTGLALDYCVYFSAIDARNLGFDVCVIIDLTKGIDDPEGNISRALEDMKENRVKFTKLKFLTKK
ncbi:MAG: bifunctional nicotinamidase/pyrazinamidase [Candidatus Lokiarchaeota archaeon]|nr:bifunctional nicotinamidase/pyrazinamidase [Candidatus Lokiarchaeota archaeon]